MNWLFCDTHGFVVDLECREGTFQVKLQDWKLQDCLIEEQRRLFLQVRLQDWKLQNWKLQDCLIEEQRRLFLQVRLQDWKLQNWKLQDWKLQNWKLQDWVHFFVCQPREQPAGLFSFKVT